MLSREESILAELLISRRLMSREALERCARAKEVSRVHITLADILIDSGEVDRTQVTPIAEEARLLDEALLPSLPGGGRLGEFRIVREIGRGGMGIVFEAVQESIDRRVALKILPAGAALDDRLVTRFLREARAVGQLEHPGIVRVFTSGRAEGALYFAMELIEGHSLADEVASGPVAPKRAARIVAQVAGAVEHAHAAGFVHRDIKPENILVGADDQPRLTDFGLVHELLAGAFTLSLHVLGTPAYIPLEQALGQPVDSRSDVYSLGAVLYTLLCGRPPYESGVPSLILARLLDDAPRPLRAVHPEIPADLADICAKAMARHPEGRYARAAAMAEDLERFVRGEEVTVAPPPAAGPTHADDPDGTPAIFRMTHGATDDTLGSVFQHSRRPFRDVETPIPVGRQSGRPAEGAETPAHRRSFSRPLTLSLLLLSVLALLVASVLTLKSTTSTRSTTSNSERSAPGPSPYASFGPAFRLVNGTPGKKWCPSLSPDGAEMAFASSKETDSVGEIYLQKIADGSVVPLKPSNMDGTVAGCPSFSPDGRSLALAVLATSPVRRSSLGILGLRDRSLRILPILGGVASWSSDGRTIVILNSSGGSANPIPGSSVPLLTVDVASGLSRTIRNAALSMPSYSPHGRRIAFALQSGGQIDLWTVAPGGGDMVRVTDDPEVDWNPVWSSDGKLLYFGSERDGRRGLWKVALNEETGHPMGFPEPASDRVFAAPFFLALSADGRTMVVAPMTETGLLVRLDLDPDAPGTISAPTIFPRFAALTLAPSPSPDGRLLAVAAGSQHADIAILPSDGATEARFLTDDVYRDGHPRWSPDGSRIAFDSDRSGTMEIWTIRPDGSDLRQITHTQGRGAASPVWSSDGTHIAYSVEDEGAFIIRVASPGSSRDSPLGSSLGSSPAPLARPGAEERGFAPSSWSPDGTTLAGSMKGIVLYSIAEGRYRRLTSFGEKPVWLPDGKRLLFTDDRKIYSLSARTGDARVVYSAEPNDLPSSIAVSANGRAIYANLSSSGEEIWLASIGN